MEEKKHADDRIMNDQVDDNLFQIEEVSSNEKEGNDSKAAHNNITGEAVPGFGDGEEQGGEGAEHGSEKVTPSFSLEKKQQEDGVEHTCQPNKEFNYKKQQQQQQGSIVNLERKASSLPPPALPVGLGHNAPLLEHTRPRPRPRRVPHQPPPVDCNVSAETDEICEKLQSIRVNFLRLSHRLGQTRHNNVVVAQFLYRIGLLELSRGSSRVSIDRSVAQEEAAAAGQDDHDPLDFSCTIMLLGKSGVGKSATINSIFDEVAVKTDAFQMGTKRVQLVEGFVQEGIKVRVIDTPGLSSSDHRHKNEKILKSVKAFIEKSKTPPDVVLYLDRLDTQSRRDDMKLFRTITHVFGPSIWFNAIVGLTHAASAPPPAASSYDMFVIHRSHAIQQAIRQAAGGDHMRRLIMINYVSLVENHSACRTNRAGQRVLPNSQAWKPRLLLLSFASKILPQVLKLQDYDDNNIPARSSKPQLSLLLSSLLASRPPRPQVQYGEEEESGELPPPFKRLTEAEISRLSKSQKKQYVDEMEHWAKLEMEEENERRRPITKTVGYNTPIPASFDSDDPTHRHPPIHLRNPCLLVRPDLVTPGWDHDVGYDCVTAKGDLVVKENIPVSYLGKVTKKMKDDPHDVHLEMATSVIHGNRFSTSLGFEMQKNVRNELSCTVRSDTDFRRHKAAAGLALTLLGHSVSAGVKAERRLIANKRLGMLVCGGGAMTSRGDVAYGASLEAQLMVKDYPLGTFLSTLGLSVLDCHGHGRGLAIGGNMQCQVPIGRSSNLIALANLNTRGAGQVSIRVNFFEHLEHAMAALVPLFKKLLSY